MTYENIIGVCIFIIVLGFLFKRKPQKSKNVEVIKGWFRNSEGIT